MTRAALAIDQGTTNTKALLISSEGAILSKAATPVGVRHPRAGWVEQSPDAIWLSVVEAVRKCLAAQPEVTIAGIGISNQRESVLIWERNSGRPLGPCVTWQCRRSAGRLEPLRKTDAARTIFDKTGLALDPMFPAAKIAWLLDAESGLRERAVRGEICAGTVDSWLVFKLTRGRVHATDAGNASRTQLFDIGRMQWDSELAAAFDVPLSILPDVRASDAAFGETIAGGDLPGGLPILAVMGDSHAALFGHGVRTPGKVKATYGTGTSLMTLTGRRLPSAHGLSTTIAWARGGEPAYALEGNISVSGQVAAFIRELLGLEDEDALTALAQTVRSSEGICFVPALAGLGAPYWRDDVRGRVTGMTLATKPAHVARAALEAIALQIRDVLVAMEEDLGARIDELSADGGASRNGLLMQLQADVLDRRIRRNPVSELSAAGVGVMAGIGAGLWDEATGEALFQHESTQFIAAMPAPEREAILETWRLAIAQALGSGRSIAEGVLVEAGRGDSRGQKAFCN
ncbi:MAG: FGGY family carbohydrate kinase [Bradyrhizobium sp.]